MSTPYNTGKVKIGAAYTPRLRPEVAHGITGPHTRPFFDRHDRIVMRACLLAIVIFSLIQLAGCGKADAGTQIKPADDGRALERYGPDEFGVVCYRKLNMEGISCVQVVQK